jgi:hypothetical protein
MNLKQTQPCLFQLSTEVQTSGVNVREVGSKTSIALIWFAGEKKHKGDGTAMVEPTIPKSFQNDTK